MIRCFGCTNAVGIFYLFFKHMARAEARIFLTHSFPLVFFKTHLYEFQYDVFVALFLGCKAVTTIGQNNNDDKITRTHKTRSTGKHR